MKRRVLVLSYAGCQSCKNALRWLKEHDVDAEVRAIVEQPPSVLELERWIPASKLPVRKWLNTSGQSYRALGKAAVDAATDAKVVRMLAADGKLVKRPVLVSGDHVLVGYKVDAYGALLTPEK